jgi:hypothetical protein
MQAPANTKTFTGCQDDDGYADSYANRRSGSPLNQASIPSTIWL